MEPKKISFGFMKTKKQDKPVATEQKEYIECVEEKSIKVVGGEEIKDEAPLVIPMKPNTMITAERLRQIAEKVENFEEQPTKEENNAIPEVKRENETLEQMAARELLEEAQKKTVVDVSTLVVPVPAQPVLEGQKESTLDDYESVPIQDFGLAMLRGMGWAPGKDQSKYKLPELRPKGLGLGADKVIKENQKKKSNTKDNEEELAIVKKSFVKITTGKYAGFYGQVVSLDEENGRAMVDIPIKKETVSLSEFMMQAVPKSEYDRESKVINADSYQEYKKQESTQKPTNKHSKTDRDSSSNRNSYDRKPRDYEDRLSNNRNRSRDRRNNSPDSDRDSRHRKKSSKKYSSNESLNSSDSEYNKSKDRRRNSTSSDSSSNYKHKKKSHSKSSKEKRDIDKKRKGKKKKRDRDRSPNYKKHRK
ncbi:G-patch domain and KOW motifs-containing protein [Colias croceus]|uniref:G-patch domain and KOW motifs-containing protein n=1 Tax=Colias crocea TaxID=72248 RepID=UPI001E27D646|nr:G-patch domain and KOW motifs-containing protein [Colias croceus]XP_045501285.1 G-patch domain and KOW motifs-containing protein [Colias croceus]